MNDELQAAKDEFDLRTNQLRNFRYVINQSMPPHKEKVLLERLTGYITRQFNAEQTYRNQLKKVKR